MTKLIFYTKPDCPLCEKAFVVVKKTKKRTDFQLEIRDITQDKVLFEKYCFDIPIIELNGVIRFRGRVTEEELGAALLNNLRRPDL
ncbi:glutaredoxin family protein [Candidatus Acetothermia bacterium]|nr:glutaredoxin family protein [Candidatus Acetothermia bacterium]MBI3643224.1 glutaredoxin family protein [Candidatus Acetothermia bacterium]